jgi:hypothetical protein
MESPAEVPHAIYVALTLQGHTIVQAGPSCNLPEVVYSAHHKMWESDLTAAEELLSAYTGDPNVWVSMSIAECALWRFFFHENPETKQALKEKLKEFEEVLAETEKQNSMSEGWWLASALTLSGSSKKKKPVADENLQFTKYLDALVGYGYYHFVNSFLMIKDNQLVNGIFIYSFLSPAFFPLLPSPTVSLPTSSLPLSLLSLLPTFS